MSFSRQLKKRRLEDRENLFEFLNRLFKTSSNPKQKYFQKICYPKGGLKMTMTDIDEINQADALILGLQVYRAQASVAAKEMINQLLELSELEENGINLFDHAVQSASVAWQETRGEKLSKEWTCATLVLDIGRIIAPGNQSLPGSHFTTSAALFQPYISNEIYPVMLNFEALLNSPGSLIDEPWYEEGIRMVSWYRAPFERSVDSISFNFFMRKLKALVRGDVIFGRFPDDKVIPQTVGQNWLNNWKNPSL